MRIWIVRKHPVLPYRMDGHLQAFTIHKTFADRKSAALEAKERNKKSAYLFTVGCVELKEEQGTQCKPNK